MLLMAFVFFVIEMNDVIVASVNVIAKQKEQKLKPPEFRQMKAHESAHEQNKSLVRKGEER
jgi:hypothetical protein